MIGAVGLSAQFQDDFSDGDFSADPTWSGEVGKFAVSGGELELKDASSSGSAYLVTFSSASQNAVWEFYHRYESNPSTSNRAEYYLMSDQADLSGPLNGYYLRIGEQSGTTDQIKLFRQNGAESTELLATAEGSALNGVEAVTIRVRVSRDDIGNWNIQADKEGGTNFEDLGSINDNVYNFSLFSGVRIKYSSTRSEGYFFFDDFNVTGEGIIDSIAPQLLQATVLSATEVELKFSEALDPGAASDITNYTVNNGIGFPATADLLSADVVLLTFGTAFSSGLENELSVSGIADVSGNVSMMEIRPFTYFEAVPAAFNEVLVTEIHPDPAEFTAVPDVEFIEIHNPTSKAFQMDGWSLKDGSQSGIADFPAKILTPGSYVTVCDIQFVDLFSDYGEVIGLDGLPSLNNSGDAVILRDNDGQLIFHIEYADNWYRDNIKADGGWSLEMIDVSFPCLDMVNWIASNDPSGGSPAEANSVSGTLIDEDRIMLIDVEVEDASNINLVFNEKINLAMLSGLEITVDNGMGGINDFVVLEPELTRIAVDLPMTMQENIVYEVTVEMIFDCSSNEIGIDNSFRFGLPAPVAAGDLRINEILFNPITGNVDFLEIYNLSGKLLSTSELVIGEAEPSDPGVVIDFANLSSSSKLIFPNDFLVFSEDSDLVKQAYYTPSPNKFLEVDMPNYPDDEGVVILFRSDLEVLDQLIYSDEWHYDLLDDEDGVSLERIDPGSPTQDENNWHSASAVVGFGTPAYMNSVVSGIETSGNVSINPEVFSPDNDGMDDFTVISYEFEKPDYTANVRIFNSYGLEIHHLVRNETLGTSGFFKWDGIDENGERARSGLYIVLIDLFDPTGNRKKYKLEVALTTE